MAQSHPYLERFVQVCGTYIQVSGKADTTHTKKKSIMFFIGEMGIKDKRVDRMLIKRHFDNPDIYYSPVLIWVLCLFMLLPVTGWFVFQLAFLKYYPFLLTYFAIGYLINSYLNNSFAITENQLHIINPNFPFRRFKSYSISDIKQITFDETKRKWHYAFVIFSSNYIDIQTDKGSEKYFCVGLGLDGFDENWTEKTIETFNYKLKEKGIVTVFNLDYD
jgi:hypothetical protein